jgi:hypothetical protein
MDDKISQLMEAMGSEKTGTIKVENLKKILKDGKEYEGKIKEKLEK